MVIKALAMSLMRVPDANVTWTDGGMLRHKHADIGVAVSIPGGLITPVVRHADEKRLSDISNEMKDLAARARNRKLAPQEYQGGSSAVSNLGMFGVIEFVSIVTSPQAASLAIGAIREIPVVKDGAVAIGQRLNVTLSADHRVADGATAAQFLQDLVKLLQAPFSLLV